MGTNTPPLQTASSVIRELRARGSRARARVSASFFKTAPGQYGHGDVFAGVTVPAQREVARRHRALPLEELATLLEHRGHECRLTALIILVGQYRKADTKERGRIVRFYLAHRSAIDNWDLVDSSAAYILGDHLLHRDRSILYRLAKSRRIWDRRIAVIATAAFIREDDFDDTLRLARILLRDHHDLIHKAVGWMLREVGNRNLRVEERFLDRYAAIMPRTMLRYAIEKLPESKRRKYLARGLRASATTARRASA
jgi:3-methyladenine DNA glycosylase AlkD